MILRDVALHDRRSFRELLTANAEGISAPVLSRRLTDLTEAGFLTKADALLGKQGRYSLTELGLQTIPLMVQLARVGILIDSTTAEHQPDLARSTDASTLDARMAELREQHIGA
ncbi:hypothetical protein GCM10009720_05260 [Yaniella flava]|uniref:HTH hxlR-type domain-containing protein n=1 Tax=Yaniella flava TaxID=287930 RepID=A0ABN2U3C9_9MICC